MSQRLIVLFWRFGDPYKDRVLLNVLDEEPEPRRLMPRTGDLSTGVGIDEVCKSREVTLQQYMEMFPDCVKLRQPEEQPSWESSFDVLQLPEREDDMRKLSTLIRMPITVFVSIDREMPHLWHRVG